jgi:hypothetical protein
VALNAAGDVLDDGPHLLTRRRLARAQDHHHRLAALHVIDVDGHEAALVVVGIPERQLLAAVHDVERVVDVERDLGGRCRKRRAELVDQRRRQPRRLPAARHVLQPAHGRLRAQLGAALGAAADGQLQQRVVSEPVEIDAVLVAAADRERARLDHLDERMGDPGWIATVGEAFGEPGTDAK